MTLRRLRLHLWLCCYGFLFSACGLVLFLCRLLIILGFLPVLLFLVHHHHRRRHHLSSSSSSLLLFCGCLCEPLASSIAAALFTSASLISFLTGLSSALDAEDVSPHLFDACVVGGGPAGLATAYHLASGGMRVLVLEKDKYPRDKGSVLALALVVA
jgi:hypothetical protein